MEMKRNLLLLIGLCMAVCVQAQKKNFSYKFYGQVRGDLFYNSVRTPRSWMVCPPISKGRGVGCGWQGLER